jgi:hypothetical protein
MKTRGIAVYQSIRRNIPCDHAPGADHCPLTNYDPAADGGVGSERGTVPNKSLCQGPIVLGSKRSIWIHGPWEEVIGKTDVWSDEDSILDGHTMIHGNVVLNLDVIPDNNAGINIHAFANDTMHSNARTFSNLSVVPDGSAVSDDSILRNFCRWMDADRHAFFFALSLL